MEQHSALQPAKNLHGSRRAGDGGYGLAILGWFVIVATLLGVAMFGVTTLTRTGASGATSASNPASAPATASSPATGHMGPITTVAEIGRSAADVPAPITRLTPTLVRVDLVASEVTAEITKGVTYRYWTFNNTVPGPMIRVMQGDVVEIHVRNSDQSTFPHSIDLHAASGPGGGSTLTQTQPGKESVFTFTALNPGLYIYHCATAPVPVHVANGMFGMILVEPPGGLPKVDHEYYVVQSEMYTEQPFGTPGLNTFSTNKMLAETPTYYVFNGRVGSLTGDRSLVASVGQKVRIFFGVGTYRPSNFHVIGAVFDSVYMEGGIGAPLERNVGLTTVPGGGTTIVEMNFLVPGNYSIVDHALQRTVLGAAGTIQVTGQAEAGGASAGPRP